ncbi:GNAT family N-acetyltransferase [Streptomyces sp. CB01881]|uniref:GNAT family N-acetyltransferase n=1 Tax=Streptomyces sp. CB01881 TaxID=2078691 RepID=UPI000CDBB700|nr:GNAT family N-acetyltransferase [Streptomyces sp. CB01881]AUY48739.1 GNAT family N-acetyltransferase [Streptomyces sp. CB01881]TYC77229.1 GNAT family N-acetyltransferase [Streptomyces sp. CB01881]
MRIRAATREDLPLLRELERAAGAPFTAIGMPEIAEDEPPTVEELAHYLDGGTALVALSDEGGGRAGGDADDGRAGGEEGERGTPVGYLLAEPVDGALHIEQVSVHPGHARRGIGRALIEHLAATTDAPALTLTTFADVPWNAPYYARFGFRPLADAEITPGLREIRRREAGHGLDRWPRLCMRREIGAGLS